ncbi:hypothetical protein JCM11641_003977 [Rhodosporidiobolus odoratus]
MTTTSWAPPAPAPPPSSSASSTPLPSSSTPFLSTPAGELALFRALVHHRLVGPTKHWDMVGVLLNLRNHASAGECKGLTAETVWTKFKQLYDETTLEKVWEEQQEQLLPSPSASPHPENMASPSTSRAGTPALALPTHATRGASRASPALSVASSALAKQRIIASFFPSRDFTLTLSSNPPSASTLELNAAPVPEGSSVPPPSTADDLDPGPFLAELAFERGRLPSSAPRESPIPEDAPLRQVSVPLPPSSPATEASPGVKKRVRVTAGTGGRKRDTATAATTTQEGRTRRGSPRKKARKEENSGAGEDEDEEESELSELDSEEEGEGGSVAPSPGKGVKAEDDDEASLSGLSGSGAGSGHEEESQAEEGHSDAESGDEGSTSAAGSDYGEKKPRRKRPAASTSTVEATDDKAAAIRALPTSKRTAKKPRASAASTRSESVAPPEPGAGRTPPKKTKVAALAATSTRGTRSSARKPAAGGRKVGFYYPLK